MRISKVGPSTWTSRGRFSVLVDFKVAGRVHPEKIADEIIPAPARQIQIAAFSMIHVGNNEHVEVLVGVHQSISEAHRLDDVDIVIYVDMFDQHMCVKPVRQRDGRLIGGVGTTWPYVVESSSCALLC